MQTFYTQLFNRQATHGLYQRLARLTRVSLAQITARARGAGLIEWP